MKLHRIAWPAAALAVSLVMTCAYAQESKPTIRHHQIAVTTPEDTSAAEIAQAEEAMQHNDFTSAEALLQKAVVATPDNYRAWFDLGYVYNATQRSPQAIEAYRKAVAAKPDVFESNLDLGLLLAKQGQNAEAAKYLRAATQLKPTARPEEELAHAWEALGRLEAAADPQQALAAFAEAVKLNPKNAAAHLAAAELLEKQGKLDAAASEYSAAAEADPASKEALMGLANTEAGQKKYAGAEATLRKLLASDPQDSAARMQLARVLSAEGKNDEATQELQAALRSNAGDPHAALELGTAYAKAGKDAGSSTRRTSAAPP